MSNKNNYTNCEVAETWLKKSGGYPNWDTEITEPIDIGLGVGCFNNDGEVTFREDNILELRISSWIGFSPGARHIYGKLCIPSCKCKTKSGGISYSAGYGVPDYISGWNIDITKELNQKAFDLDDEGHPADKCFEDMYLGEDTIRFERDETDMLIAKTKVIIEKWFTGDWELKIVDNS